ncbi:GroES-like protein [Lindgomyces ingoldianus]|uniref:GroES-like protein n=1 Tax=Lindgomyces ingoldianus TaxID=673940 RepID=A0ACB6RCE6_9PLEO|nr:GroES-like protein [Lindgomyces ingoldianus]KAF2476924.1 GroES-like protein [Lindgomyces ingoldianus]
MRGVTVEKPGAKLEVRSDLEVPEPSDTQILIKSIYAAINPGDVFMADFGILVVDWPLVPGCDAGGVVIKAGKDAVNPLGVQFKEGDEVCGCTRLGSKGYSPWQEYFLMDAAVTIPKPSNIDLAQASTTGVGVLTAFLGVFDCLKIPLVDPDNLPSPKNEWALVFGGASSVGKFAVQTLKACGYKVVTTCSAKSVDLLKSLGADVTIDYKKTEAEIVEETKSVTSGELNLVMDAVSVNNALATAIYAALTPTSSSDRLYTTTNGWDPLPNGSAGFTSTPIMLGPIGRPDAVELNAKLNKYIPVIVKLLEAGKLRVGSYMVEGEGVEGIEKAWALQKSGKAGSEKVLVKIGSA